MTVSKDYFKKSRCRGSGKRTTAWPGDEAQCFVCGNWARVRQDGNLGAHKSSPYQRGEDERKFQEVVA